MIIRSSCNVINCQINIFLSFFQGFQRVPNWAAIMCRWTGAYQTAYDKSPSRFVYFIFHLFICTLKEIDFWLYFQIEYNMTVCDGFPFWLYEPNVIFAVVDNQKENCHYEHVYFNLKVHWENYTSNSFHIEWDMIMGTVFLSIWTKLNSIWFKIERKTVITIISHSMWKEMEI